MQISQTEEVTPAVTKQYSMIEHYNPYILLKYVIVLVAFFFSANTTKGQPPLAEFSVDVSRSEIWQYDSYIVTAKVKMRVDFDERLQFWNLGSDVATVTDSLIPDFCWFHQNSFSQLLYATRETFSEGTFDTYKILEIGISPAQAGIITIPPLSVTLLRLDNEDKPIDTIKISSQPQSVLVKALPESISDSVYSNDYYRMVGAFRLSTFSRSTDVSYMIGDTIFSTITVIGRGSGHPIELNVLPNDKAAITYTKVVKDTAHHKSLRNQTTFNLKIVPKKRGELSLNELLSWTYYSVPNGRIQHMYPEKTFLIVGNNRNEPQTLLTSSQDHDLVVVLDVSESMRIEDYGRNRLSVGVELVNNIMQEYGPVPVVIFNGNTKTLYPTSPLDTSIINLIRKPGTAIGDAIWQAKELLQKEGSPQKRVVLICDGDNMAGSITETLAAHAASDHGIVIQCLGLGYKSKVPFGHDAFGNVRYIADSYDDSALKKVARITGGKFLWVSKEDDLSEVVRTILRE